MPLSCKLWNLKCKSIDVEDSQKRRLKPDLGFSVGASQQIQICKHAAGFCQLLNKQKFSLICWQGHVSRAQFFGSANRLACHGQVLIKSPSSFSFSCSLSWTWFIRVHWCTTTDRSQAMLPLGILQFSTMFFCCFFSVFFGCTTNIFSN